MTITRTLVHTPKELPIGTRVEVSGSDIQGTVIGHVAAGVGVRWDNYGTSVNPARFGFWVISEEAGA